MTRVAEAIRGYLGWCPDRMMMPPSRVVREDHPAMSVLSGERTYTMQDMVADCGSTGLSVRLFSVFLAVTIAGLYAITSSRLFEGWYSVGLLVLGVFILGTGVRIGYQDREKAVLEFAPDAITVRRPLSEPVIVPKDTITAVELRDNIQYTHRWFFRGAAMLFLIGVIPSVFFSGQQHFPFAETSRVSFPVLPMFWGAAIVFFGFLFYHGFIRSRYPHVLAIHTNTRKIVGLYVDDPGEVSAMLARWRSGGI